MGRVIKFLKRKWVYFLINHIYNESSNFNRKNKLLKSIGIKIDDGSKIVGPLHNTANLIIGKNCWIGRNFSAEGNGDVVIEDNCDIAPNVTILTGSHKIGGTHRRAGEGYNCKTTIGSGTWLCANVTVCPNVNIGKGNVVAAGTVVIKSTPSNFLICGVPGTKKKELSCAED